MWSFTYTRSLFIHPRKAMHVFSVDTKSEATTGGRSECCFSCPYHLSASKKEQRKTLALKKVLYIDFWPRKIICHYFASICIVWFASNLSPRKILDEEKGKERINQVPTTLLTIRQCDECHIASAFKEHIVLGKGGKQTPKQERAVNC